MYLAVFSMQTCETGLNKGYKMQSISIFNCFYLILKIKSCLCLWQIAQLVAMVHQAKEKVTLSTFLITIAK